MTTTPATHSAEVDALHFDTLVVAKSHEVPVLVDFWAAWCGPCQALMPRLAKLAAEYQGKFFLAKVNTDVEQKLAGRYGVRSLPTVKLFRNGAVVDEFVGAIPDPGIRAILDRHVARESDALLNEALTLARAGAGADAVALLRQAAQRDPANDRVGPELVRVLLELGRLDDAEEAWASLPAARKADAGALAARLEFARLAAGAPPLAELEKAVAADPANSEARYRLGARRVMAGDYEAAMQQLLEIVRRDRRFRDDAGRKALLGVFQLLAADDPLVGRYRALLARVLY